MDESYSGPMIKLTTTNYSLWKFMMDDILNCKDLYDLIEGDNAKPYDMSYADWKKLKKKTLGVIRQWVDINLYNHISKETNPHSLEELGKHVRDKECTSKDFLDAEADEFEAQGRPINY